MALSLFGERTVAAGSRANPFGALLVWLTQVKANRARRAALLSLLELDSSRLRDLGITPADISEAMSTRTGMTSGMVLNAARARSARS